MNIFIEDVATINNVMEIKSEIISHKLYMLVDIGGLKKGKVYTNSYMTRVRLGDGSKPKIVYVTPYGLDIGVVAEQLGITANTVRHRCKKNDKIITKRSLRKPSDLTINEVGKTYRQLGYYRMVGNIMC